MAKQYGLVHLNKKKNTASTPVANFSRPSVFGSDSESDDDNPTKRLPIGPGDSQKRLARMIQSKALAEDPTIFQYDELYDDMESKREEEKKAKTNEVKKAKYIEKLLETAEHRKKEHERRIERQVQKEREEEGEMFADKESFVTSSYRKKLEEMRQAEELEKREEYLEQIGDVTKQSDLGGFYRHLYDQKTKTTKDKKAPDEVKVAVAETLKDHDNEDTDEQEDTQPIEKSAKTERTYRKRNMSEKEGANSSDDDQETSTDPAKKAHIQSNLDADSDFSIDSSSDEEDGEKGEKIKSKKVNESKLGNEVKSEEIKTESMIGDAVKPEEHIFKEPVVPDVKAIKTEIKGDEEQDVEKKPVVVPKKPKIDVWKKRTVGAVFDEAVQKYYERKAAREASG